MAAAQGKVIITCAVTGAIHTPTMSPHLPVTPEEIAEGAIGAAQAGAAIVHLHAREPADGRPTQDPAMFMRFLPKIKAASNVVINLTTGGAPTMTVEERLQPALKLKPEVASLNMGSMNFGLYEMLGRYKDWKYDWEKPYLAGSDERIFKNTFRDITTILESCRDNDTRFEIECYDIGHLYTAAHFLDRRLIKPPLFIQSVFGIRGGIGPHPEDVLHMKRTADRLFGDQYLWSVLGAGRNQMYVAAMSAVMGGNVRVGLEDSLWLGRGALAKSNAEQVAKIRRILEELGLQVATPDEAREMLKLKGGRDVAFLADGHEAIQDRRHSRRRHRKRSRPRRPSRARSRRPEVRHRVRVGRVSLELRVPHEARTHDARRRAAGDPQSRRGVLRRLRFSRRARSRVAVGAAGADAAGLRPLRQSAPGTSDARHPVAARGPQSGRHRLLGCA